MSLKYTAGVGWVRAHLLIWLCYINQVATQSAVNANNNISGNTSCRILVTQSIHFSCHHTHKMKTYARVRNVCSRTHTAHTMQQCPKLHYSQHTLQAATQLFAFEWFTHHTDRFHNIAKLRKSPIVRIIHVTHKATDVHALAFIVGNNTHIIVIRFRICF